MKTTSKIVASQLLEIATEAAMAGARVARARQLAGLHPRQKSADQDDLVTEGDEAAQQAILSRLPRMWEQEAISILAEEKTAAGDLLPNAHWRWVIDPIDGTLPYSNGQAIWCVSIALQERMNNRWESQIGIVYQASPSDTGENLSGKLFWAETGRGAFFRDLSSDRHYSLARPLELSKKAELGASGEFAIWARKTFLSKGITAEFHRCICHAATELFLGRKCAIVQDAGPMEWDVAAICVIAREAGASLYSVHTDDVGGCARYAIVIAWQEELFAVFRDRLADLAAVS